MEPAGCTCIGAWPLRRPGAQTRRGYHPSGGTAVPPDPRHVVPMSEWNDPIISRGHH